MSTVRPLPWPAVAALNAVSAVAQVGQFGVGFVVMPLWLAQRGLGPAQLGLFAALQWAGMLAAIYAAPWLAARWGARMTVCTGLCASVAGFALSARLSWPGWLLPALLFGAGIGLRWIANETWLYRLIPAHLAGRVTGVHETLISLAELLGPVLALWCGVTGVSLLWSGAVLTACAALPLLGMGAGRETSVPGSSSVPSAERPARLTADARLGIAAAIVCGVNGAAFYALFPKFCDVWGVDSGSCARLLAASGVGGVATQWLIGCSIDRYGVKPVALACAALGVVAAAALQGVVTSAGWAWPAAFVLGGACQALLTIGMATAAMAHRQLERMMRLVSVGFTLGAIAGPLVAAAAIEASGADALMYLIEGLNALLAIYALGARAGWATLRQ